MSTSSSWEAIAQDLRYALRQFRRNPGFTAVAIAALTLGIGATTAVYSVVDHILWRALPYLDDERLVTVGIMAPIERREFMLGSPYADLRDHHPPFEAVTSWTPGVTDCDLTDSNPLRLGCASVEANFLNVLGVQPVVGRDFTSEDDRPGAPRVALLSYALWRSRFGGDPGVPGKTLSLDGEAVRIAGVLPRKFEMPSLVHADLLVPQSIDWTAQRAANPGRVLRSYARLRAGVTPAIANEQLQPIFREIVKMAPPYLRRQVSFSVRSLRDLQVGEVRPALRMLLGAVLLVLLVTCANVANLLLARAAARQREMAVRGALGASRLRLLRQTLAESLLLGVAGGTTGCFLAYALLRVFITLAPADIPRLTQAGVDLRVLAFAVGVSLVAGVLFGLAPALVIPRPQLLAGGRFTGVGHGALRQMLVTAQVAVSLVLLAGAGLLLRSFWNLQRAQLGMDTEHVMTATVALGPHAYSDPVRRAVFFDQLEDRLRHRPGVDTLAMSDSLPPSGMEHAKPYQAIQVEGLPRSEQGAAGTVAWRVVTPGYFSALRIPILEGQAFREEDRNSKELLIILSESLARRLFANQDAVNRRLALYPGGPWYTVTAVAGDVKNGGVAEPPDPEYYLAWKHASQPGRGGEALDRAPMGASLILRSPLPPESVSAMIRSSVAQLDPSLPVKNETMKDRVSALEQLPRFNTLLLAFFAALAVTLAALGLYGVVAYLVVQRTQEVGVRMALGAQSRQVLGLFIGKSVRLLLMGVGLGLAGSWAFTRFLQNLLFGVTAHDPLTLTAVSALLVAVALLASYIPSRRATRVDPVAALRHE
jgi:putative ABC transport system permease protein